MKKILFIGGGSYVYGKEKITLSIGQGLQENGFDILYLINGWNDGKYPRMLSEAGIPFEPLKIGRFYNKWNLKYISWNLDTLIHLPHALLALAGRIKTFKPDIIYFDGASTMAMVLDLVRSHSLILHHHENPTPSPYFNRILRRQNQLDITHLSVSKHISKALEKFGLDSKKIFTIHNGIDFPPIPVLREDKIISSHTLKLGIIGQVAPWKGHEDLIEALRIVKTQGYDVELYIAGSGEEKFTSLLRQKISNYDLTNNVSWLGYIDDASSFYREVDVCIVPSRSEDPFPTVALEAGAFGLPVIATRRGGLLEIVVDQATGMLIEANNPANLADAIVHFAINQGLIIEYGENATKHIHANFSREVMIRKLLGLVRKIM